MSGLGDRPTIEVAMGSNVLAAISSGAIPVFSWISLSLCGELTLSISTVHARQVGQMWAASVLGLHPKWIDARTNQELRISSGRIGVNGPQ
jgi:hypothetical protein